MKCKRVSLTLSTYADSVQGLPQRAKEEPSSARNIPQHCHHPSHGQRFPMPIIFVLAWSLSQVNACKMPRANAISTPGPSGTQPPTCGWVVGTQGQHRASGSEVG